MIVKQFIKRCTQNWYVCKPPAILHSMIQQVKLKCIKSWCVNRTNQFHYLFFQNTHSGTKCFQLSAFPYLSLMTSRCSSNHGAIFLCTPITFENIFMYSRLIDKTTHDRKYYVQSTIVLLFQHHSNPTIQGKPVHMHWFSSMENVYTESWKWPIAFHCHRCLITVRRIDVHILPSGILS